MFDFIKNIIKQKAMLYCAVTALRTWTLRLQVILKRTLGCSLQQILDFPENLVQSTEPSEFKYELTVCLKFKNEARFLDEWIRFHQLVGVEHFYLYNNNSNDDYSTVLQPHIASGLVTLHEWPAVPAFPSVNVHCARTYRNQARWIAFLDADEFLFGTTEDDLRIILKDFRDYPAVVVNWLYFGWNGHVNRPAGLVIENYTRREQRINEHIKSIVNPRKVIKAVTTHYWLYTGFERAVNEKEQRVTGGFSRPPSVERLRINHYYDKSREDFFSKIGIGTVENNPHLSNRLAGFWHECCRNHNQIEDLTVGRYILSLNPKSNLLGQK